MVNNHPTPREEPENKGGYCKSQTNMHYVSNLIGLLLVKIQSIVYNVNKAVYRKHHFTTSCGVWKTIPTCYYRNKSEVETKLNSGKKALLKPIS